MVCKSLNGSATCLPGCTTDDRCRRDGGGAWACCSGACTDTGSDTSHCGGCGHACAAAHAKPTCAGGACTAGACDPGWGDCDKDPGNGCETNLHVDPQNCNTCGAACTYANGIAACSDGCYIAACNFGYDDCNNDPK